MRKPLIIAFAALLPVPAIAGAASPASESDTRAAILAIAEPSALPKAATEVRDGVAPGFTRAVAYDGITVLEPARVAAVLDGSEARSRAVKLEAAAAQAKHAHTLKGALSYEPAARELESARDAMNASLAGQNDGALVAVLLDLGQVDFLFHREDAAREAFRQARAAGAPVEPPTGAPDEAAAIYREAVASLQSRTGATLEVLTSPAGARVVIDGRVAGISPYFASDLVDGPHVVRTEILGRLPVAQTVTLEVGKVVRLSLKIPPPVPLVLHAGTPEEELASALAAGDALGVDFVLLAGLLHQRSEAHALTFLVDVRRRALISGTTIAGDPTDPAVLDKAGTAAGERLREHRQNAPPLPTPPALRFDEAAPQ